MSTSSCPNPNCRCDPCLCGDDCRCGYPSRLGELERQVMDVLWAAGGDEVTARDVADALPAYAYTTVATVLNRLSRKGVARRRMDGRTTRFAAVESQADRAAAAMQAALESSGDPAAALDRFVRSLPPEEAAALRSVLEARR